MRGCAARPKGIVCVFAKPPQAGKVKTRLAGALGDVQAAKLARAFLEDTWAVVSRLAWAEAVIATTEPADFCLPGKPLCWLQGEGDLGQRIERVLRHALCQAEFAIAIGADTPGLPERLLEEAAAWLAEVDAVLGPSEDGGFYLLGLKRCPAGLLEELPWSEPKTFAATYARLVERGLTVRTLEPWFDVDRPEDIHRLQRLLDQQALCAPATARFLAGLTKENVSDARGSGT